MISTMVRGDLHVCVRRRRNRPGSAALWVLIALLGATVVALGYEVRVLKPQADDLRRRKALPYVGQLVPKVQVATTTGDSVTVGETTKGRSQVLYFFATSCAYCKATYPGMRHARAPTAARLRTALRCVRRLVQSARFDP